MISPENLNLDEESEMISGLETQNPAEMASESPEGKPVGADVERIFGKTVRDFYVGARVQLNRPGVRTAVLLGGLFALSTLVGQVFLEHGGVALGATTDGFDKASDLAKHLDVMMHSDNAMNVTQNDMTGFQEFGKVVVESQATDPSNIFTGGLHASHGYGHIPIPKPNEGAGGVEWNNITFGQKVNVDKVTNNLPKADDAAEILIKGVTDKFSHVTPEQNIAGVKEHFAPGSAEDHAENLKESIFPSGGAESRAEVNPGKIGDTATDITAKQRHAESLKNVILGKFKK